MIEAFGIVATVLAVTGVWLNNRKKIACFKIWIFSNLISLIIHIGTATYSLALRDAIFIGFAIEGIRMWRR